MKRIYDYCLLSIGLMLTIRQNLNVEGHKCSASFLTWNRENLIPLSCKIETHEEQQKEVDK